MVRYRLRFEVAKERVRGEGSIAEPKDWDKVSARTSIVELPERLSGTALEDAIADAAAERKLTQGDWRR